MPEPPPDLPVIEPTPTLEAQQPPPEEGFSGLKTLRIEMPEDEKQAPPTVFSPPHEPAGRQLLAWGGNRLCPSSSHPASCPP